MRDDYEVQDCLVRGVYTRSLLYFISGVLEGEADMPLAGMHRYHSGIKPYNTPLLDEVRTFLTENVNHLVLSDSAKIRPESLPGFRSSSLTHGGFDDDPFTRASLKHIIAGT
jgi:hypothetical protein